MYLVATCTDRKRLPAAASATVRDLRRGPVAERAATWIRRLEASTDRVMTARDLYSGESWSVARSTESLVAQLFVVSAGYGLVTADDQLCPYAATFSLGVPDSVGENEVQCEEWWRILCEWRGPSRSRVSLSELSSRGVVLIAASWQYLVPLRSEIERLPPERVLVCSAGAPAGLLDDYRLPVEGRFRTVVGGSMMAVNTRVARHLLEREGQRLGRGAAERILAELAVASGRLVSPSRVRLTDDDIRTWIVEALSDSGDARWTALHRRFRDAGLACEQRRFRQLFREVVQ